MLDINKIYNQDCMIGIKSIPDKSIDLIITDTPYSFRKIKSSAQTRLSNTINSTQDKLNKSNLVKDYDHRIWAELIRVMKKINMYIWCSKDQLPELIQYFVIENKCSYDLIIWNKTNPPPTFNNKYITDKEFCLYVRKGGYCQPVSYESGKTVYYQPANVKDKKQYNHPTIKPLNIIENLIKNSSRPGDLVLDPFIGSGTTAVASILNNRNYIGFETNKKYYDICLQRINDIKGERYESVAV